MAEPLRQHTGHVGLLMIDNVDTDQIIPSREMKTVSRKGLAEGLFAGWRYIKPGSREPVPGFVLNRLPYVSILVSGENFGCGSSREHAAWALAEFGIRAVIAKSFGEIFFGNCILNGILPAVLKPSDIDQLISLGDGAEISIDLELQTITSRFAINWQARFDISPFHKAILMDGLDPIGLTLRETARIRAFHAADRLERPWVYGAVPL